MNLPLPIKEVERKRADLPDVKKIRGMIVAATDPKVVWPIDQKLGLYETIMEESGLYTADEKRLINEARMLARHKFGRLLKEVERAHPGPRGKDTSSGLTQLLTELELTRQTALEAQRIGAMPEEELEKEVGRCHQVGVPCSFRSLIKVARPWWYQASRKAKHETIQAKAVAVREKFGPFPLIYADPPWKFDTFNDKGLYKTPTQHYPTLTTEEIMAFEVDGKHVSDLATKRAALFLWCTSSNLTRGLAVMEAWGFEFKASATWVKMKDGKLQSGTGLIFRNAHEVILYGTRGDMPGPQWQPMSAFLAPRGKHSEKPHEVRKALEKMYPDFSEKTRLELFAREKEVKGWTTWGNEA